MPWRCQSQNWVSLPLWGSSMGGRDHEHPSPALECWLWWRDHKHRTHAEMLADGTAASFSTLLSAALAP